MVSFSRPFFRNSLSGVKIGVTWHDGGGHDRDMGRPGLHLGLGLELDRPGSSYLRGFSFPSLVLQIFKNAVDGPGRVPQSPRTGRF